MSVYIQVKATAFFLPSSKQTIICKIIKLNPSIAQSQNTFFKLISLKCFHPIFCLKPFQLTLI